MSNTAQKMATVARAARKTEPSTSSLRQPSDSSAEESTESGPSVPSSTPSEEELLWQAETLRKAIELSVGWVEEANSDGALAEMPPREQILMKLQAPLMWVLQEALISYDHENCDDCKLRRESNGNNLALAIAVTVLGYE